MNCRGQSSRVFTSYYQNCQNRDHILVVKNIHLRAGTRSRIMSPFSIDRETLQLWIRWPRRRQGYRGQEVLGWLPIRHQIWMKEILTLRSDMSRVAAGTKKRQDRKRDFKFFPCFRRRGQICTGYGFMGVCFATVAQSRYKFCTDSGKFAIIEAIATINLSSKTQMIGRDTLQTDFATLTIREA